MKRALVFGIGGFVGPYLERELVSHGVEVSGTGADVRDAGAVSAAIREACPDTIINLAAVSSVGASWGMPAKTMEVNAIGTVNILEAARQLPDAAGTRLLFIGSSEEYEAGSEPLGEDSPINANNPYGISKVAQSGFVRTYRERYGMRAYYVRPFNHTGVGQRDSFVLPSFCRQAAAIERSGKPGVIKAGNLSAERDFSDVRDIVRAYRMILENDDCTRVYNVGSGTAYSLRAMLDFVAGLSSQPITIEIDPARFRPVDTPRICCDYSRIHDELGWEPEYSIFDTLKEMYRYYCKQT